MSYIKVKDNVITYPYSMEQLLKDNPNTSFSMSIYSDAESLKEFFVYRVEPSPIPSYDAIFNKILPGIPELQNNIWYQTWNVIPCSEEEVAQNIETAKINLQTVVQNRLDEFARTRNYDSILSCCTYATSTNTKFQQEAQYAVQARDAHWAACYTILQEFEAGQRTIPTVQELLSLMPPLQWPN